MSNADSIETSKSIFDLVELLKQIEEEQKTMTEEEKKHNEWATWDGDVNINISFN